MAGFVNFTFLNGLYRKHAGDTCTYWTKVILALKGVSEIWGRVLQFFYSANGLWQIFQQLFA